MYTSRPASPIDRGRPPLDGLVPLGIGRAERRRFDEPAHLAHDPAYTARLEVYLTDLLRPYGLALAPDFGPGHGQSYGEMAEAVLECAIPPGQPVELVVLAFAMPDLTPGRATATYLSHVCPGNQLAFAICDQGAAAAFTGLRLIGEYHRSGGCARALLMVAEQTDLPYRPAQPTDLPAASAAVALLCGDPVGGPGTPDWVAGLGALRQHADVTPEHAGSLLAAEVADLSAGCADVTLILGGPLGAGAAELPGVDRVRRAPAGQPATGVWWELVGELSEWKPPTDPPAGERVLVADFDPQLRYLCVAAIDVSTVD
jgi:4-hydroxymandelate oxidase